MRLSQISADDLFFLLGLEDNDSMANLWGVALDDSGDERKTFIIAGSLMGNKADWNDFNKAWRKVLRAEPSIEYFHQTEYASHTGEFRQFWDKAKWPVPSGREAAKKKRDALLSVIAKSELGCCAMLLRAAEYESVRGQSQKAREFLDKDPWTYLLQELAFNTSRTILTVEPKANIAFIAGPHDKAAQYESFYEGFKKKNGKIAEHMLSMTHGNYKKIYSLQAVDLIASESKKLWECADRKESDEEVLAKHPIISRFVGFDSISKKRLEDVVSVQRKKRK